MVIIEGGNFDIENIDKLMGGLGHFLNFDRFNNQNK